MKKYEKYLMCNLGYMDNEFTPRSLVLMDISSENGHVCDHCKKEIKGNVYHFNEYAPYGFSEWTDRKWTFDYKCMPYVVGAGLK
ncbi:hypothetical protein F4V43_02290 [Paenibacillus spiritus]|uniref:Uncharacterized protein n=1 Tax=Paenibacillus spiritus TaxID=2496557 RepID=A0A5J5GGR0_9BACL|nr:hypothetical protein [Paenibacillus spiritus]KAA9007335.1 hypothetical protein F4V43_02290 [Paenibacillus spiritus]